MIEKIKATNPYSGQSEMLTPEEHKLYIAIKEAEREVNRHNLSNYDFRDVDDLYFQSDEQARAEAKEWINSVI